jgi:hypothetical protein
VTNPDDPLDITNPDDITSQVNPPDPLPQITPTAPPSVVVLQQPAVGRGRRGAVAPEPKKTELQKALPSPERVKIERRRPDGHKSYVGHYSWAEVQRYGSFELFLQNVVVPRWKGGEYELTYVRADKSEQPHGTVIMEEPPSEPTAQVAPLDQVVRLAKELQRDAASSTPAQIDPIEQMSRMMALQKQMGAGSGDSILPMMMMQMMQRPEPRPDPMDSAMRMFELAKSMQPPPAPLPMMPIQTGPDPMLMMMLEQQKAQQQMQLEMMRMQQEANRQMFESLRSREPAVGPMDVLQMAQQLQPKDNLGARDILPMITTMKDLVRPPEKDGLREHLEAFRLMRHELKEMSDDGRPSGFREFAESVLPDGLESITKLVQAIRGKEAAQAQQLAGTVGQQPAPQQMPQIPPGFADHAKAINRAKDATEAMGAALNAMYYLGQSPDFRPSLETLIGHARAGQMDEALDLIKGFLEGIGRAGLITQNAANIAMQGFEENWDEVAIHLTGGQPIQKPIQKPKPPPTAQAPAAPLRFVPESTPTDAQVIPIMPIPGIPITPSSPDGKGNAS